ncbi:MAG: polysaccharide deacetylase family protein [Erythrobacter sp.]
MHAWVNPPFDEEITTRNSFAGNLPAGLEEAKFMMLRDRIEEAFGAPPLCYRAGRYGLGPHTADLLRRAGIAMDTSVRTLFDYSPGSGPDYSHHPLWPYWVDEARNLLELPVSSVYRGALKAAGPSLQRMQRHIPTMFSGFSRLRLLERIAFTPEGVSPSEGVRGVARALELCLPVMVLSLHSPSLAPGHTPYAKTPDQVEGIYQWLATIYGELARRGVASTTIAEIIAAAH